jgi:hypothetical protein
MDFSLQVCASLGQDIKGLRMKLDWSRSRDFAICNEIGFDASLKIRWNQASMLFMPVAPCQDGSHRGPHWSQLHCVKSCKHGPDSSQLCCVKWLKTWDVMRVVRDMLWSCPNLFRELVALCSGSANTGPRPISRSGPRLWKSWTLCHSGTLCQQVAKLLFHESPALYTVPYKCDCMLIEVCKCLWGFGLILAPFFNELSFDAALVASSGL